MYMMKKKGKYGINSGNTFKFGSMRYRANKEAKNQHIIIKTIENRRHLSDADADKLLDKASAVVDDGGLTGGYLDDKYGHRFGQYYSVEYALGKRKRWLLPDIIKLGIDNIKYIHANAGTDPDEVDDINVILHEREIPCCGASAFYKRCWSLSAYILKYDCVGYHDSGAHATHAFPRGKYSFIPDLQEKCRRVKDQTRSKRAQRLANRRGNVKFSFSSAQRKKRLCERKLTHDEERQDQSITRIPQGPGCRDGPHSVQYEVCRPIGLMGHRNGNDYSHRNKYTWESTSYLYYGSHTCIGKQRKSPKKCKNLRKRYTRLLKERENDSIEAGDYAIEDQEAVQREIQQELGDCLMYFEEETAVDCRRKHEFVLYLNGVIKLLVTAGQSKQQNKRSSDSESQTPHPNRVMRDCHMKWYPKGSWIYISEDNDPTDLESIASTDSFVDLAAYSVDEVALNEIDKRVIVTDTIGH